MERASWLAVMTARKAELLCAVLLCIMAANLVGQIRRKSITNDETVLIPAGYYHLVAGEFHLVYEHPPLCKLLSAIPLLFIQPNEIKPEQLVPGQRKTEQAWGYEMAFWTNNRDRFETICFWTRLPMIALTLGLGVLVFLFARDLFGPVAAVLAVALFTFEPTILAHGRTVQTDVPAALGYVWLFYAMYRYAAAPSARRAAWIGVAAATGLLAKFSMLLAGPILLVFFVMRLLRPGSRRAVLAHVGVVLLAIVLVVNAAYFFQHRAMDAAEVESLRSGFGRVARLLVPMVAAAAHVLPLEFLLGILWQVTHSAEGHTAGLLGMYKKTGWWYYFPVAFALKATIPFLVISGTAISWAAWRLAARRDSRFLWLLVPIFAYSAFVLFTGINIGVRYYIPAYVFLCLLGGAFLASLLQFERRRALGAIGVAALLGWCAIIAARAYPDYMPYMNAFASARPTWWYLSDSNVEWGDDVKGLADYLHARGEKSVRAALLGGFITLQFYDIGYVDVLSDEPQPETRYVALGASFLNGSTVPESPHRTEEQRVNRFDAFRRRTPEAVIGGSIYVFRMYD